MSLTPRLIAFLLLVLPLSASAADVQIEGFYRARGRVFDNLSLNRDYADKSGTELFIQHRLWLRPKFILNENVALITEFKGLDNVVWGNQSNTYADPVTGLNVTRAFLDEMSSPTSKTDETAPLLDFTLWRAWGEVHTPIGLFKFGRQPLHWGLGVWQNDGLGREAEYGDSADRVSWELLVQDQIYIRAAMDANVEGFLNQADDTVSWNLGAAYRSEIAAAGVNLQVRRTPSLGLNLLTGSIAGDAELGVLEAHLEVVGQFGQGDLDTGASDVSILGFGGVLDAAINLDPWRFNLQAGFATGDKNPNDEKIRSFSFDRDFQVALMLFERPLPTLGTQSGDAADGRNYNLAQTGFGVSNAIYFRPRIERKIVEGLTVNVTGVIGLAAALPDDDAARKQYGAEIDLGATYAPYPHVDFTGTFGALIPGNHYGNYVDDVYDDGFKQPAFAGQLLARVKF